MSILPDVDLKNARVLVLTGAGVSTESGIPTFRGKDGYWRNLDPAKLATPERFARDPKLVWEWYQERRQRIRAAQPNAAHRAIVKLAQESREFLLVTQNVDDLHARAEWEGKQLATEMMVQIHGDIFVTRCSGCDWRAELCDADRSGGRSDSRLAGARPSISQFSHEHPQKQAHEQENDLPRCPRCEGLMQPGVIWFGEQLDSRKIDIVENFLARGACDLVFVVGTTALFGYIVDWAVRAIGDSGQLVEVNPEETPLSQFATQRVRLPAAIALPRLVDQLVAQRPKL